MKKIINWFKESHRWQHFVGGFGIGLLSLGDWYTAAVSGIGVASALEYKDKLWGGKWDWIDLAITVAGVAAGFGVSQLFKTYVL